MINLKKRPIIKIIALVSAVFLLGQNIAWADPDIFFKNTLQPQTLFTRPAPEDVFLSLLSGYLGSCLNGIEDDPRNRNLARIKSRVNAALKEIQGSQDIPEEFRDIVPADIKFYQHEAAVIIDLGQYKIRYFNHNIPGTEIPEKDSSDFSYKVLQTHLGRYLSRQILIREEGVLPSAPAVHDENPADPDREEGGNHDPDKVSKAVSAASRRFNETIEELKVNINEELSIDQRKLYMMHGVFARERDAGNLNKTESFFTWLELYRTLLEKQNKKSAALLGKLYKKALDNPNIIRNGKWIEDFSELSGELPLNEKYELIKRIELFENDELKISPGGIIRTGKEEKAVLTHMLTSRIGGEVLYEELRSCERLSIDRDSDSLNIAPGLDGVIFDPGRENREFSRAAGTSKWVKLLNAAYSEIKTRAAGSGVLAERLENIRRNNRSAVEIKVAYGVPGNCARYKDIIFFDEQFVRIILTHYYGYQEYQKVSAWILAERLLHELSYTPGVSEERLIEQDLAVYKEVISGDPAFGSEITAYFREKKPAFASGNYFTFLKDLSGLTDEREIDGRIRDFVRSRFRPSDEPKYHLKNKKGKKQLPVFFGYRMPGRTMEILKRKAGEALGKGEITREAYELLLGKGLGWIDEEGEIRIPHNLKIYVLAKEAEDEAAGADVTGMFFRYMRYIRFYLSVYSAIEKFRTKHGYDIWERVMGRLRQYPHYSRLLELYRNRYGRFPDENGEEDEKRLIASLVVTYAAGRALGKETVDLLDGEGRTVKLDDFWPLASYIIKDELWAVENGITRAKNAVLAKNADMRSSFNAAEERQEQFSKRIFDILRIKHGLVSQLLEAIRILEPDLEARLSEEGTGKEYSWALEEDITCIKEYMRSSGRTIIDKPFLEKAFVALRENLDAINSFDVFLRAAALIAACEQDKMMYTADLNFESAFSAGMRALADAGKRLGILMAASGLNDRMLAKKLGINSRTVHLWRNGRQRIPCAFLPALSEIFSKKLNATVSASVIKHGKPLPELMRKMSTFGERLYELRILAGLNQRQLSEAAHRDKYSINHWEREFHLPNSGMSFYNLARALDRHIKEGNIEVTSLMFGISLDEFLKGGKVRDPGTGEEVEVTQAMRIRVLRISSGLTQGELAKKAGCDVATVIRWENGTLTPGRSSLWELRDIFRKRLKKDIEIPGIIYGRSLEELLVENRTFGERIKLLRHSMGMGIVRLSGAMGKAGHKISEDTIGKWEREESSPKSWDSLMPFLGIYHERTGKYLDGTLLFYGKPLGSLLGGVKLSEGFKMIKYCRVSAGLTLEEISGRLGISPYTYKRWEKGRLPVTAEYVIELTGILSEELAKRDTVLSERLRTRYFEPLLLIPRNAVNAANGPRNFNRRKKPRPSDRLLPKAAWDGKRIVNNAGLVVPWLIQSMIDASENMSIKEKNDKIVLFLDDDLTELNGKAAGNEVKKLIRMLAAVKNNNEDLRRFLRNLEIVRGRGRDILNKKGSVKAENVIVVTRYSNRKYFNSMKGRAVIAAIDDNDFSKSAYLPLLEVTLFAIGKYLGWDESMLRRHYENIPNAVSVNDLNKEDYNGLFDPGAKDMVIRLVPNAAAFDTRELVEMIERIRDLLRKA
ncbi:MAG: helix-turn-helix domain-containing protein [Candidatus Omnitrophota bacterium]|nr:helix-turn-helix domain-containing protein [Candidatus Omnitrophota bacterium]